MTDRARTRYEKAKRTHAELMKVYPFEPNDLNGEIWADIVGYEGHYQISTFGRVKSFYRGKQRILAPFIDKDGYFQIALGRGKKFKIHRLVATAFIPNPDDKPQINHIDGNKMNNHVNNLEWCTNRENQNHALQTGLIKSSRGNVLEDKEVLWCRKSYIPYDSEFGIAALARKFNIDSSTMCAILRCKTYKDVDGANVSGVDVEQTVHHRADCRHNFR